MDDSDLTTDTLLQAASGRLTGHARRLFQAEVTEALCGGSARRAERRFGWGRANVATGLREHRSGVRCLENFAARGRPRWEDQHPALAQAVRDLVEPRTQTDPELKSTRRYTNLSAAEVRVALRQQFPERAEELPSERSLRDILNRMGYRLKRIQKGKPLKKPADTDAIFANVAAVRAEVKDDPHTLELSMDTKTKVKEGEYARGGKNPDRVGRDGAERTGP
jgi:hypothetical protein